MTSNAAQPPLQPSPIDIGPGYRLSPQQTRLYQLFDSTDNTAYRCLAVLRLTGRLHVDRLSRAYERLVQDHEILRTIYRCPPGMRLPLQYILDAGSEPAPFDVYDMRASSAQEVDAFLAEFRQHRVHPEQGPISRIAVLQIGSEDHRLMVSQSALAGDRRSLVNIVQHLLQNYESLGRGEVPAPADIQYADAAEWMAQLPESEDAEPGLAYWARLEADDESPWVLPLQGSPQPDAAYHPARQRFRLPPPVVDGLEGHGRDGAGSAEAWLLACWQILLARLSGRDHTAIAVWHGGRDYPELVEALGLFGRYLPVYAQLDGYQPFKAWVTQVQATLDEAARWQHYAATVDDSHTYTCASGGRYFPIGFELAEPCTAVANPSVTCELVDLEAHTDRFHLLLVCATPGDGGWFDLVYDPNLYDDATVERLGRMFEVVTLSAWEFASAPLAHLDTLSLDMRREILNRGQGPRPVETPDTTVLELIAAQVRHAPQREAVLGGEHVVSYGQLWQRAHRLADILRQRGVEANRLVGICMHRSPDMVVAIVGVLLAGGAYVPIDPSYPEDRKRLLLEDARLRIVLTQRSLSPHLASTDADVIDCDDIDALWQPDMGSAPRRSPRPQHLAYVIYTSGSTGRPKGVAITHANLQASTSARFATYPEPVGRYLLLSSFAFDSSVAGIFWTLCQGGALILPDEGVERDATTLCHLIANTSATHLLALPSLYRALLEAAQPGELATLRTVIVAGEPCPTEVVTAHQAQLTTALLYNEYGPTEATVWCTVFGCNASDAPDPVPIGQPIPGVSIYVLDSQKQLVPTGVAGEIHIGGAGLSQCYLAQPRLTASRFIPDPYSPVPGSRMYATGDWGRWLADGALAFMGRIDDQVKLRGYRIELGEIESVLQRYPGVRDAVVLVRADRPGEALLVGYVVPSPTASIAVDDLRAHLASRLPDWMVPASFVLLESLPLGPNGKIARQDLLPPQAYVRDQRPAYRAPQDAIETALKSLWEQVLQGEDVGIDDNFFHLGGDSLLGLQMAARARQLGLVFTTRTLFQYPTISELAPRVEVVSPSDTPLALAPETIAHPVPLTPIQQWFFARQLQHPNHYHQAVLLQVPQPMDAILLEQAIRMLVARHDALRLRFTQTPEGWRQASAPTETNDLFSWFDLRRLPQRTRQTLMQNNMAKVHRSFDLERGPLCRIAYFRHAAEEPDQLLWVIHHLAVDAVSWGILLRDLETVYRALEQGETVALPSGAPPFPQWAAQLEEMARHESVRAQRTFWENALAQEIAAIPVDHPQGANREADARQVTTILSEGVTQQLLLELPRSLGTTIHDILLATLGITVAQWSGGERIRLDTERHGRDPYETDLDISATVGWFTVIHPVWITLPKTTDIMTSVSGIVQQLPPFAERSFAYSLLRYGPPDVTALSDPSPAGILFNYLGQLEAGLTGSRYFSLAQETPEGTRSPLDERAYLLEIEADIRASQLHIEWRYSHALHDRETIERQATNYGERLAMLCASFQK